MSPSTPRPDSRPLAHARTRRADQPGLPFADLLPEDTTQVLGATDDPIYPPQTTRTLFAFPNPRRDRLRPTSRRPVAGVADSHRPTALFGPRRGRWQGPAAAPRGRTPHARSTRRGRRVPIADGTTVTAADTPANQAAYPQPDGQQPGLGFPMLRLVVLFGRATGAVVEAARAPDRGKGTGALALLRRVWHRLQADDILRGDGSYCSYFERALLQRRGVDVVLHKQQSRRTDFRTGRRWGRRDHVITWDKPARPDWRDEPTDRAWPATLTVREVRVQVSCPAFRVRQYEVITTLLAAVEFPDVDLAELYRRHWAAETDLRSVKSALGLDQLRGKSPALVRKELWVYRLGSNLIRGVMVAGALPSVRAVGAVLARAVGAERVECLGRLWRAVGSPRVGDRPGRVEPRALKRRKKNDSTLNEPRNRARQRLLGAA